MKCKAWWNGLSNSTIILVLLSFVTLVISLMMSEIQGRVGVLTTLVCATLVYVAYLSTSLISFASYVAPVNRALANIEAKVDLALKRGDGEKFSWIVDNDYLRRVEVGDSIEEVWVVSSDLVGDIEGGSFVDTVQRNLERGVKYTYFVPDTAEMQSRAMSLKVAHGHHSNLCVCYLNREFFFVVKDFDFIIYNPMFGTSPRRCGYMGLPINSEDGRWTAKISDSLLDALFGQLNGFR